LQHAQKTQSSQSCLNTKLCELCVLYKTLHKKNLCALCGKKLPVEMRFNRKVRKEFKLEAHTKNVKFAKLFQHKALRTLRFVQNLKLKKTFAHFAVKSL